MDNATFREVSLEQTEAEELSTKPETSPPPSPFSKVETNAITPPLTVYESLRGRPYTADFLGIVDLWNLSEANQKVDDTFGKLKTKVKIIEGYINNQIKNHYMEDTTSSYKDYMKMIDKLINFSSEKDELKRLDKIYSFVLSTNKTRAMNSLRKALLQKNIDELLDLKKVKASHVGKLMPRNDA